MSYAEIMEAIGKVVDAAGVGVIILGLLIATIIFLKKVYERELGHPHTAYRQYRAGIGRGILLGLEILIAGDIIRTVAIELTFESLGTLAILVAIRTFLSFSLETEIMGRWPWRGKSALGKPGLDPSEE